MALFSKRHYTAISTTIKQDATDGILSFRSPEARLVIHTLSEIFAKDNPEFDRQRFLNDCGMSKYINAGV